MNTMEANTTEANTTEAEAKTAETKAANTAEANTAKTVETATKTATKTAAKPRHPEKARKPDQPSPRKPDWIRVKAPVSPGYKQTKKIMEDHNLVTVCQEASCPNIGECWTKQHATMMIMGDTCTRACSFCNVITGKPAPLNPMEPFSVAASVKTLGLKHVVVTSVDRDDLDDGGAGHMAETIGAIRQASPGTTIEVLTPDFLRKGEAWRAVAQARPDVFNHNLETVPRLYRPVRPGSDYAHSLQLLKNMKAENPKDFTKSGLMVGLGEQFDEMLQVMDDMRAHDVDFITIGQYLQPTIKHHAVIKFWHPDEFKALEAAAWERGFLMVSATPLTRSSYHAGDDFAKLKANRTAVR